jgi:hypothetical protein
VHDSQNGDPKVWDSRGKSFFDEVYGDQKEAKLDAIYRGDPDLGYYVDELYGNLISDTTYLSYAETELEVVVTLSMISVIPQVKRLIFFFLIISLTCFILN